ncbi:aldo/keto reductase [Clostridium sp. Marseille-P3244]|uniref:aldo/keto reductase n=1 Tax=Clostridium sp. Marseille-P3244 TaxID=1871020 RepID=UPI000931E2D8|nr:aldo/keto reductase [Clostridium sp. Marseille-P3244]
MKRRILGKDLEVSAVGLGCMGMSHAYGPAADKKEMKELLSEAVDRGYTFFDTAEVYGTPENPHDNEELLGEALAPYRNHIVLVSKCGIRFDETSDAVNKPLIPDGRPETIKEAIDGSLKRLRTDRLDLYYIHRIDRSVPIEETAGAMKELMDAGKITHWGISEADEETLRRAHSVCPVTAVQNRYSMMYRDYESLFPVLEELQIGFVAFSPLANGLLSAQYHKDSKFEKGTDYRSAMPQFTPEAFDKNEELIRRLKEMADNKNATPAQISLAWMMAKKSWIVPIPGTRKYGRLIENAQAADVELSEQEVREIDRMLDTVPMSEVFGGSKIKREQDEK